MSQRLAGAFGLAILSTVAADRTNSALADGSDKIPAFVDGFQLACLVSAVVAASAIAMMLLAAREPAGVKQETGEAVTDAA